MVRCVGQLFSAVDLYILKSIVLSGFSLWPLFSTFFQTFATLYTLLLLFNLCTELAVMHVKTVFSLVVPGLAFLGEVAGLSPGHYSDYESEFGENNFGSIHVGVGLTTRQIAKPALRILPLGASIVSGVGSSTGNGLVMDQGDDLGKKTDMVCV